MLKPVNSKTLTLLQTLFDHHARVARKTLKLYVSDLKLLSKIESEDGKKLLEYVVNKQGHHVLKLVDQSSIPEGANAQVEASAFREEKGPNPELNYGQNRLFIALVLGILRQQGIESKEDIPAVRENSKDLGVLQSHSGEPQSAKSRARSPTEHPASLKYVPRSRPTASVKKANKPPKLETVEDIAGFIPHGIIRSEDGKQGLAVVLSRIADMSADKIDHKKLEKRLLSTVSKVAALVGFTQAMTWQVSAVYSRNLNADPKHVQRERVAQGLQGWILEKKASKIPQSLMNVALDFDPQGAGEDGRDYYLNYDTPQDAWSIVQDRTRFAAKDLDKLQKKIQELPVRKSTAAVNSSLSTFLAEVLPVIGLMEDFACGLQDKDHAPLSSLMHGIEIAQQEQALVTRVKYSNALGLIDVSVPAGSGVHEISVPDMDVKFSLNSADATFLQIPATPHRINLSRHQPQYRGNGDRYIFSMPISRVR